MCDGPARTRRAKKHIGRLGYLARLVAVACWIVATLAGEYPPYEWDSVWERFWFDGQWGAGVWRKDGITMGYDGVKD